MGAARNGMAGLSAIAAGRLRARVTLCVPAVYAVAAGAWIAASDSLLLSVHPSVDDLSRWSTMKGLCFVAVTTIALHLGLRWALRRGHVAEAAAESARRRYELLAEHTRDVILFVRSDGWIVDANAAATALYGWSRDELRALRADDLRTPRAATAAQANLAAAEAAPVRYETEHRRRDGSSFPVEVTAQGARLDGEPVLVCVVRDVTERNAVQSRMMQSDRLASVGMLAAGVAHEINNPLSYLGAALEFLHENAAALAAPEELRGELLRALEDARQGAERVRHVVRDLRTLSGRREERRARIEVAPVLEAALHVAASELRHRARVVRELGPAPAVLADEARLGQVALNLLLNAAQAIPEAGGARHEIRVVVGTDASGRAVFEVRDTGSGIPPEVVDRIFDPFFTTKPPGVGTGLGLSICRGIVDALGGEISVESRVGAGTTVRVALPPAPGAAADDAPAALPGPPAALRALAAAGGAPPRSRVLVVDDEPPVSAAIRRILAARHDVVVCGSGLEALDAVRRGERFDAIVCDLMMPGMTGMELHEELLGVAPDQARRFVVLTGGAYTPRARRFLARYPIPRCEKPFEACELRELVGRVAG